ncbi:hypothetical protein, partial [Streptomyces sp. NPDC005538]|uniref:hypothetical protein n=1 Tax=Streptomyces sp. NPDC005538 TaxID=3157043 RepID=UPI0033B620CB
PVALDPVVRDVADGVLASPVTSPVVLSFALSVVLLGANLAAVAVIDPAHGPVPLVGALVLTKQVKPTGWGERC